MNIRYTIVFTGLLGLIIPACFYAKSDIATFDLYSFSDLASQATPVELNNIAQAVFENNRISDQDKLTKLKVLRAKRIADSQERARFSNSLNDYKQILEDNIALVRNIRSPALTAQLILSSPDRFKKYLVYVLQFGALPNNQKQEIVRYLSTMNRLSPKDFTRAQFTPLAQLLMSFIDSPTSSSFLHYVIKSNTLDSAQIVAFLLNYGANPNQADPQGATPLLLAPNQAIRQLIIDKEASL